MRTLLRIALRRESTRGITLGRRATLRISLRRGNSLRWRNSLRWGNPLRWVALALRRWRGALLRIALWRNRPTRSSLLWRILALRRTPLKRQ